jgi:hypothetical protein
MTRTTKSWLQRLATIAGLGAVFYLLVARPTILRRGFDWLVSILNVAADVFLAIVLPLAFIALCAFIYTVWVRTWLRALHIRRIRNARQMREAVERSHARE